MIVINKEGEDDNVCRSDKNPVWKSIVGPHLQSHLSKSIARRRRIEFRKKDKICLHYGRSNKKRMTNNN